MTAYVLQRSNRNASIKRAFSDREPTTVREQNSCPLWAGLFVSTALFSVISLDWRTIKRDQQSLRNMFTKLLKWDPGSLTPPTPCSAPKPNTKTKTNPDHNLACNPKRLSVSNTDRIHTPNKHQQHTNAFCIRDRHENMSHTNQPSFLCSVGHVHCVKHIRTIPQNGTVDLVVAW